MITSWCHRFKYKLKSCIEITNRDKFYQISNEKNKTIILGKGSDSKKEPLVYCVDEESIMLCGWGNVIVSLGNQ